LTITLDGPDEQHESSLVTSSETLGRIADGVMLPYLEQTNSIVALFACENWNGLKNLEYLYVTDDLHSVLEELFASLLRTEDSQVTVHIKNIVWELSDYRRCSQYFSPLTTRKFLQVIIFLPHLANYIGILHIAFGKTQSTAEYYSASKYDTFKDFGPLFRKSLFRTYAILTLTLMPTQLPLTLTLTLTRIVDLRNSGPAPF